MINFRRARLFLLGIWLSTVALIPALGAIGIFIGLFATGIFLCVIATDDDEVEEVFRIMEDEPEWGKKRGDLTPDGELVWINMGNPEGEPIQATIGHYADFLNTGIWEIKDGTLIPPPDLTEKQLKDFRLVFGELFEEIK